MSNKTQPARGMRDFLPADVRKRNYVINIIREVYESYGFEPLETPAVENLETLTGKYGEEGGQLMFKILKRGEKLHEELESGAIKSESQLSDLALRYDLTVPLARVVANYRERLPKFFKRYQIQPVWRADRPARGRYREFYQCDVDAIGSNSALVEAELISAVSGILKKFKVDDDKKNFDDFVVLLNHRSILQGVLEVFDIEEEKQRDVLVAIDKFDKIGESGVAKELLERNAMPADKVSKFIELINYNFLGLQDASDLRTKEQKQADENDIFIQKISDFVGNNEAGTEGISVVKQILNFAENSAAYGKIRFQPNLARGLSYYTGAIIEIGLNRLDDKGNLQFSGSIGGGGRYDGLIGMFGKEQIPACGFSLGLERILVVMEERNMFPPELSTNAADVLVTVWNEDAAGESLKLANELRQSGLRVLVYPQADKFDKQLKYASQIDVPFVCILGDDELRENNVTLKNMRNREQETVAREDLVVKINGV